MKHHSKQIEQLKIQRDILLLTLGIFVVCIVGSYIARRRIISPVGDNPVIKVVYASEEASQLEQITSYIIKKFQPEGRIVAVHALNCFISESGLRPEAYNFNTNGTGDYSIAQVNSVHVKRYGTKFMTDWKENIDTAYKIFVSRGHNFSAWYGKGC